MSISAVCALLLETGVSRLASNFWRVSGSFMISCTMRDRRSAMSGAMLCGANKVFQPRPDRFRPDSLSVGMSGAMVLRRSPDTASTRILPASCWGSSTSKVSMASGTWPPTRSVSSGAEPL